MTLFNITTKEYADMPNGSMGRKHMVLEFALAPFLV